jgi:protein-S-isoprenylcysteine O-methyltransferase Ste14
MLQWIFFIIGTFLLVTISWRSLQHPRSHGFYRFFAWEAILALFLLNVEFWFYEPFSWNQIIAWLLLVLSLVPLSQGVRALRGRGKPTQRREGDPSLLGFEKTTVLVTTGIYLYIRHPLYSALLLLTWGVFFKSPSIAALTLAAIATLFLIPTARADETECIHFFGNSYREYMRKTKMFIPYLFGL